MAEEVVLLYPNLVSYTCNNNDNDCKPDNVYYQEIIVLMVEELKKLKNRITILENK